ncbi:MAG: O-antigen ligase family protein [Endomicrobium sp.]|jgi:putative inorganic carbon (HCO3(-)) transporter|nr:O-antigen ligase family protein [Endomicrobium sp.]
MIENALRKTLIFGLPVFYFLMAISFYLGTYDSAQIKITIFHIGGLFLIMTWLLLKIEEASFSFFKNKFIYIFPVFLLLLSGAVSFSISPYKLTSLNEFLKRFIYCGIVFILVDIFDDNKKILNIKNWLIAASFVVCTYGILQIFDYHLFPKETFSSGLDPFVWRQAFSERIMSTFGNPNFFGDFLIVMSAITLALFVYKKKFYIATLWFMIAICSYHTMSKGTWLGLAFGLVVFVVLYMFIFLKNKISKKLLIILAICVLIVSSFTIFSIYNKTRERIDSASFRVFTWLSTWEMLNTKPVLGTGIGTFYLTYPSWRRPQIFFIEGKHNTESDHPEDEYLEMWYDEGIVGLTIFLLLVISVLVLGYKNILYLRINKTTKNGPMPFLQLGILCAFAAQLVHDFVCVSLRFVSSGVMFWLLIGITLSIATNSIKYENTIKNYLPFPIKLVLQVIVVAIFAFAIMFTKNYFTADLLHAKAIILSRGRNWDKALSTYSEVNKNNPSYVMAKYFKLNVHMDRWKAGDDVLAEKTLQELWDLAPNFVQSKWYAGMMYMKMFNDNNLLLKKYIDEGRSRDIIVKQEKVIAEAFSKAEKYYKQYIEIDPIFPMSYYGLSSLYAQVGNFEKSEKILLDHLEYPKRLLEHPHDLWIEDWSSRRKNDYSETYNQLGYLYLVQRKFDKAESMYLKSLELSFKNINAKKNLALLYGGLGRKEEAYNQWIEIHKINPRDKDAIEYIKAFTADKELKTRN